MEKEVKKSPNEEIDPDLIEPFKQGRKALGEKKRTIIVKIAFNEAEYKRLKELKELTNIREVAPYCRAKSLENTKLIYASPKYILEYKSQIMKIGVNLNQLVKLIPIKYPLLNVPSIHKELSEMKALLEKLMTVTSKIED